MAKVAPNGEVYSAADADDVSWIQGKTLLCTGVTDGLGLAGIKVLCESSSKPKHIIIMARNPTKAEGVKQMIEQAGMQCSVVMADSCKPKEIIAACREIEQIAPKLDCIWNNAGIWTTAAEVQKQEDDLEFHFATNFFAMALLFTELQELLKKSTPARMVVTGSFTSFEMMKGVVQHDNLQCENGKHKLQLNQGWTYAHSKLLQHVWSKHYATLLPDGVTINIGDPGAVATNIDMMEPLKKCSCIFACFKRMNAMRTPEVGCRSLLHLIGAKAMDGKNGMYLDWGRKKAALIKRQPVPLEFYPEYGMKTAPSTEDPAQCKQLYEHTEKILASLRAKYGAAIVAKKF